MKEYSLEVKWRGRTKVIPIRECETEAEYYSEWEASKADQATWYSWIGPGYIRAFFWKGAVYEAPDDDPNWHRNRRHEIGHAFKLGHTWLPTTMNPVHFLRWFDLERLGEATVRKVE